MSGELFHWCCPVPDAGKLWGRNAAQPRSGDPPIRILSCSSRLVTARIVHVATRAETAVVSSMEWPSNTWMKWTSFGGVK